MVQSENKEQFFENITIEKFKNGERIKVISFSVKAAEKGDLTQLVMNLLITIAEKHGYKTYFDPKSIDPFAKQNESAPSFTLSDIQKARADAWDACAENHKPVTPNHYNISKEQYLKQCHF